MRLEASPSPSSFGHTSDGERKKSDRGQSRTVSRDTGCGIVLGVVGESLEMGFGIQ